MAVRFSAVTLAANDQKCRMLIGGVPTKLEDFEGWTMFENFVDNLDDATDVNTKVDTYLYGEGEIYDASPDEVAYFMMREKMRPDFLDTSCSNIGVLEYDMDCSQNESFGMEMS